MEWTGVNYPVWRYTAKNALQSPSVPAVDEFKKAITEAEKQQAAKSPCRVCMISECIVSHPSHKNKDAARMGRPLVNYKPTRHRPGLSAHGRGIS